MSALAIVNSMDSVEPGSRSRLAAKVGAAAGQGQRSEGSTPVPASLGELMAVGTAGGPLLGGVLTDSVG